MSLVIEGMSTKESGYEIQQRQKIVTDKVLLPKRRALKAGNNRDCLESEETYAQRCQAVLKSGL